ncbi:hypothetical protein KKA08_09580 [bacterium]|nr:hypothetical protein [bacterium]
MNDTFYNRLNFYRMLNAGITDLNKIAVTLDTSHRTLARWKRIYDPDKGPFGEMSDIFVIDKDDIQHEWDDRFGRHEGMADRFVIGSSRRGTRREVVQAIRQSALEGNVQAAKLLLTEYEMNPPEEGEMLTVDRALDLLREWDAALRTSGHRCAKDLTQQETIGAGTTGTSKT